MTGMTGDKQAGLPAHIAIIMDGNGRWAARRGLSRSEGHKAGAKAARIVIEECRRMGIPFLTLYAFSSENWNRPAGEIAALFSLLLEFLTVETARMEKHGVALHVLGDMEGLPAPQRLALQHAINRTKAGNAMQLNLAINYGGRAEIVQAAKKIMAAGVKSEDLTPEIFGSYLYTAGQPDPDLLIRTSGELRMSNFLPFQTTYSELFFTPVLWPDFDREALLAAVEAYRTRKRRFGKTE